MTKPKAFLLLAITFFAGIVLGVTGTRIVVKQIVRRAANNPELVRAEIERKISRDLHLRPEQREKLHGITVGSMQQMKELRREFHPRLAQIIERSEGEVRAILDEDQKQRFDQQRRERPFRLLQR